MPSYGGPVPPGGWEQPIPQAQGWQGQPLASWGSRLGAYFIDGLILLVPVIVLTVIVRARSPPAATRPGGSRAFSASSHSWWWR